MEIIKDFVLPCITSFGGAFFAFKIETWRKKREEKQKQKELLIKYFYDLKTLERNLKNVWCNVYKMLEHNQNIEQGMQKRFPIIKQEIAWGNLGFVCEKDSDYYEFICQLPIEVDFFYGLVDIFQKEKIYIDEVNHSVTTLLIKTCSMMDNTNKYFTKYFKEEISNEVWANNIHNSLNERLQKHAMIDDGAKKLIEELKKTKEGWCVNFDKK